MVNVTLRTGNQKSVEIRSVEEMIAAANAGDLWFVFDVPFMGGDRFTDELRNAEVEVWMDPEPGITTEVVLQVSGVPKPMPELPCQIQGWTCRIQPRLERPIVFVLVGKKGRFGAMSLEEFYDGEKRRAVRRHESGET